MPHIHNAAQLNWARDLLDEGSDRQQAMLAIISASPKAEQQQTAKRLGINGNTRLADVLRQAAWKVNWTEYALYEAANTGNLEIISHLAGETPKAIVGALKIAAYGVKEEHLEIVKQLAPQVAGNKHALSSAIGNALTAMSQASMGEAEREVSGAIMKTLLSHIGMEHAVSHLLNDPAAAYNRHAELFARFAAEALLDPAFRAIQKQLPPPKRSKWLAQAQDVSPELVSLMQNLRLDDEVAPVAKSSRPRL